MVRMAAAGIAPFRQIDTKSPVRERPLAVEFSGSHAVSSQQIPYRTEAEDAHLVVNLNRPQFVHGVRQINVPAAVHRGRILLHIEAFEFGAG